MSTRESARALALTCEVLGLAREVLGPAREVLGLAGEVLGRPARSTAPAVPAPDLKVRPTSMGDRHVRRA
jgi:hypothetical protein